MEKEIEKLKKELEKCKKEKDQFLAGWQRQKADFLNYKKEEQERVKEILKLAKADLIFKILPILDNFEKAKKEIPKNLKENGWAEGVFQIQKQILDLLKNEGLKEIQTLGQKLDLNFHEVIEEIESKDFQPGEILEEVEKGYLFEGQLLRPAKVKIVKQKNKD